MVNLILDKFAELYSKNPLIVRAPGRINIIGEHTDYNEGFVLPAAINKYIYFAIAENNSSFCNIYSFDKQEEVNIDLSKPIAKGEINWANYLLGVINELKLGGHQLGGLDCVFGGNIPIGAGLSSSAALECGFAFGIDQIFNLGIEKKTIAEIGQQAEHKFAGTKCGIMDQFASVFGKKNNLIKLDCKSLEFNYILLPDNLNYEIIIANTGVKHELADSEYNKRRAECEQGVAEIKKKYPEINSLRDISLGILNEFKKQLNPTVYKRCEYVIEENIRVENTCKAIIENRPYLLGSQLFASHDGLQNKYEVSCIELDDFVEWASEIDAVLGSRMMGGGFGGCTINIVVKGSADIFKNHIKKKCLEKYNFEPDLYLVETTNGIEIV